VEPAAEPVLVAAPGSTVEIIDLYLEFAKQNRSDKTYNWYLHYLQSFCKRYPTLKVSELNGSHVREWVKSWAKPSRRAAITCIKRAFTWAAKEGIIPGSPIAHVEKPEAGKRGHIPTEAEYKTILKEIKDQRFKDLVSFVYETGCRPQEAYRAEWRHFDAVNSRLVIPPDEAKGKKKVRIVYLNKTALAIVNRNERDGHLFLNRDGKPFDKDSVNCRFLRLKKKLKRKYCLYQFRHVWCHRALTAGVDSLTVSTLMGHSSPQMIAVVYGHLNAADDHMKAAVNLPKKKKPAHP
jgi:integrase